MNRIAVIYKRNHSRLQVNSHGQFQSKGILSQPFSPDVLRPLNHRSYPSIRPIPQQHTSQYYDQLPRNGDNGPLRPLATLQPHIDHPHPGISPNQNLTALDQRIPHPPVP